MTALFSRKARKASVPKTSPHFVSAEAMRLLMEYVLHMSITCLANEDISPLYEEYVQDSRLGALEKEELTQAYFTLQLRSVQTAAGP